MQGLQPAAIDKKSGPLTNGEARLIFIDLSQAKSEAETYVYAEGCVAPADLSATDKVVQTWKLIFISIVATLRDVGIFR